MKKIGDEIYLTTQEISWLLGVSARTISNRIKSGELVPKPGGASGKPNFFSWRRNATLISNTIRKKNREGDCFGVSDDVVHRALKYLDKPKGILHPSVVKAAGESLTCLIASAWFFIYPFTVIQGAGYNVSVVARSLVMNEVEGAKLFLNSLSELEKNWLRFHPRVNEAKAKILEWKPVIEAQIKEATK